MSVAASEPALRICVYGAGAVGTVLGVWLAHAGHDVTLIARGPHLAALRTDGATISVEGRTVSAKPRCVDGPDGLPPQDFIFVTAKSPALPTIVPQLARLAGISGTAITVMNGLPWWMFPPPQVGDEAMPNISCLDPDGLLSRSLPIDRIIGCVANIGASVSAPGRVKQSKANLFTFGEPDGSTSERLTRIVRTAMQAGIVATTTNDIRRAYWQKLLGNASFGPISVLSGATNGEISSDAGLRRLCLGIMGEIAGVGRCLGFSPTGDLEERVRIGARLADHKTSMLQDFEAGRPLEIDSIVTPIVELARHHQIDSPLIEAVWALLRHRMTIAMRHRIGDPAS